MTTLPMDPRLRARRIEVMRLQGRRRLRALVLLVAGTFLVLATWWAVVHSPWLDVNEISVQGVERTPESEIIEAAGVTKGQPLVEVDTKAARESIAELPWVHTVTSDRRISGDVSFTVTERRPVAVVQGELGWLLVDAGGRVLEAISEVPPDVVVVDGSAWHTQPGEWVGESALPPVEVAALLPTGLRAKVASIRVSDEELELILFGGGVVSLGDSTELDDKFLSALTLLVRIDMRCLDRIDVRAPAVPVLTRVEGCT